MTSKQVSLFLLLASLILTGCGPNAKEVELTRQLEEAQKNAGAQANALAHQVAVEKSLSQQIESDRMKIASLEASFAVRESALTHQVAVLTKKLDAVEAAPTEISGEVFVINSVMGSVRLGRISVLAFDQAQLQKVIAEQKATGDAAVMNLKPNLIAALDESVKAQSAEEIAKAKLNKVIAVAQYKYRTGDPDAYFALQAEQKALDEYSSGGTAERAIRADFAVKKLTGQIRHFQSFEYYQEAFKKLPPPLAQTKSDANGKFRLLLPKGSVSAIVAFAESGAGYDAQDTQKYHWVVSASNSRAAPVEVTLSDDNFTSSSSPDSLLHTDP